MPIRPSQSRDPVAKLGRWADMRVRLVLADTEPGLDGRVAWKAGTDETLGVFGAVWDRKEKRWAKPHEHKLPARADVMRLHRGQEEAARWLADWLRRWGRNDWRDYKRMWSALLIGGRRSGKTHLCVVVLLVFAVMKSRAITWVISPTIDTGNEIDEALTDLLPAAWKAERYQATNGRSTRYLLPNGSQIMLRSGINPSRLKAGKADVCLYNEAQLQKHDGYVKLRGGAVDRGGLVLLAANPPDQPIGLWVEEHYHRASRGELDGVAFQLDPLRNPWIQVEALLALAKEVDEKTFNREVRGIFEPIGNLVMHAWRTKENNVDPRPDLIDVTREVSERLLGRGRGADFLVGMDFQVEPYLAATVHKLFRDPDDPSTFINWIVDEFTVAESDEFGLLDAIENTVVWTPGCAPAGTRTGEVFYTSKNCAVVMDASAWFQDHEHHKGRQSDRKLRSRGWHNLHRPQADSDANPLVKVRVQTANAALKRADGRRLFYVARHCTETAEAMGKWEMHKKLGIPDRASRYTHLCDCCTYVEFRLRGVSKKRRVTPTYDRVVLSSRADELAGY